VVKKILAKSFHLLVLQGLGTDLLLGYVLAHM
jgi:hypothetical protein